jgi:LPXTG-site transpeptidase (sortase) family protein
MNIRAASAKRILVAGLLIAVMALAACSAPPSGPPPAATEPPPAALPAPGDETSSPPTAPATPARPAASTPAAGQPASAPEPPLQSAPHRLVIPAIGVDTAIVDVGWEVVERGNRRYTEWQTADNAAGRHLNSARPGEQGNVVLSGHHNTKGEVFRPISEQELAVGDMIYLYDAQGQRFVYQVTEITEPLPEVGATEAQRLANARYIQPTSDARVTLVTCWPYWTNTHRIVVVGELVQ